jgi:hypothetical protein
LNGTLSGTDPVRARSVLQTAVDTGNTVGHEYWIVVASAFLARIGGTAQSPEWATQFRHGLDVHLESGDTGTVLVHLGLYADALATTDRAEAAALLSAAAAALAPHMSNPISIEHRRETRERLLAQLGEERFAELSAQGATLGSEEALALAFGELDRVIAEDQA